MLADFINEGHLSSHIRRLRGLYSPRRERLLEQSTVTLVTRQYFRGLCRPALVLTAPECR